MDIGSHDLFMDIHYLALDKGNTGLAEVAKKKADELDDRPTDDDDDDDDFTDSSSSSGTGEEEEEEEEEEEDEEDVEEEEEEVGTLTNGNRMEEEILPGVVGEMSSASAQSKTGLVFCRCHVRKHQSFTRFTSLAHFD